MVPESDVVLVVDGAVEHNLKLSFADLARFPSHSLCATDELGKESLFEGVLVAEILKSAGVKFGKDLRRKRLADYLLAETPADGYRVVFALGVDPIYIYKNTLVKNRDSGRFKVCRWVKFWHEHRDNMEPGTQGHKDYVGIAFGHTHNWLGAG
jgi:hypothetical protein